ncbi:hypothetical protein APPUASWS_015380 [Arthrospira platensis str. Paraca]|nr:hypothetical protein APPUASWS_015380 [Arthrospira platensis str. Paraca]
MDKISTNSQLGQKSDHIKSLDTNLDFYNSKTKVNASRLFANQSVILGMGSNPKPRNAVLYFNTQSTII